MTSDCLCDSQPVCPIHGISPDATRLRITSGQYGNTDCKRLDWLMSKITGAEFRRIGVLYSDNCKRSDIDEAMTSETYWNKTSRLEGNDVICKQCHFMLNPCCERERSGLGCVVIATSNAIQALSKFRTALELIAKEADKHSYTAVAKLAQDVLKF